MRSNTRNDQADRAEKDGGQNDGRIGEQQAAQPFHESLFYEKQAASTAEANVCASPTTKSEPVKNTAVSGSAVRAIAMASGMVWAMSELG